VKVGFSGLPSFGLVCTLVLGWLVMFHMQFYQWGHFQSKAITVSVMNHASAAEDPWTQPLMLTVQSVQACHQGYV